MRTLSAAAAARAAMAAVFFANGFGYASWVARIPAVRQATGLNDGQLGTALFALGAGALVSFPLAGRGTAAMGARVMTLGSAVAYCLTLPGPTLVGNFSLLVGALFLLGAANGVMDVSMNALAVEVEAFVGKRIMSSLHGMWSAGGLAGATLGGLFAKQGVTPGAHLLIIASILAIVLVVTGRWLPVSRSHPHDAGPHFARPEMTLVGLGAIIFCSFLIEGAMADWSAVWLHDVLGTSAALAALGYSAFSLTMTAMRFAGDGATTRWGADKVLGRATAIAALALAAALWTQSVHITMIAFALVGIGVATVAPVIFSAAARRSHRGAGQGIAAMATMGYSGFLLGPAVIGWVAQATTLRWGLGLVAALLIVIAALAHRVREPA